MKIDCRHSTARRSFHFELVLKVQPIGIASDTSGCDRLFVSSPIPKDHRGLDVRDAAEFSKTVAAICVKKPPTRAEGPGKLGRLSSYPVASCGRSSVEVRGLSYTALSGSPGMVATLEAPVKRRENRMNRRFPAWTRAPSSRARGNIEVGDRLTVDLDGSLADQAFARGSSKATSKCSTRRAGRCTGSLSGRDTSGTSSGA